MWKFSVSVFLVLVLCGLAITEGRKSDWKKNRGKMKNLRLPADEPVSEGMENVLRQMHSRLVRTYTLQNRDRSALNVLQEKFARQEVALGALKNEIHSIKTVQHKHSAAIDRIDRIMGDTKWAVSDLRGGQTDAVEDRTALKKVIHHHQHNHTKPEDLHSVRQDVDIMDDKLKRILDDVTRIKSTVSRQTPEPNSNVVPHSYDHDHVTSGHAPHAKGEHDHGAGEYHRLTERMRARMNQNLLPETRKDALVTADARMEDAMNKFTEVEKRLVTLEEKLGSKSRLKSDIEELRRLASQAQSAAGEIKDELYTVRSRLYKHETTGHPGGVQELERSISGLTDQLMAVGVDSWQHQLQDAQNKSEVALLKVEELRALVRDHNHRLSNSELKTSYMKTDITRNDIRVKGMENQLQQAVATVQFNQDRLRLMELDILNKTLDVCKSTSRNQAQDLLLESLSEMMQTLTDDQHVHRSRLDTHERGFIQIHKKVMGNQEILFELSQLSANVTQLNKNISTTDNEISKIMWSLPEDCASARIQSPSHRRGNSEMDHVPSLLFPVGAQTSYQTACSAHPHGWTLVQQRVSDTVDFNQTWDVYKRGFGDPRANFWIGNEALNLLTSQKNYSLRIDMWSDEGLYYIARYRHVRVADEDSLYSLFLDGFHGNATDSLTYSSGSSFSTYDMDNDAATQHCAKFYTAGWWFRHCHFANLNGRANGFGIVWFDHSQARWIGLNRTSMWIKPHDSEEYNLDYQPTTTVDVEEEEVATDGWGL